MGRDIESLVEKGQIPLNQFGNSSSILFVPHKMTVICATNYFSHVGLIRSHFCNYKPFLAKLVAWL